MNILEKAKKLVDSGLSVIFLNSKNKKPLYSWEKYQKRRPTTEEIEYIYNQHKDSNPALALVLGRVSDNIIVIDFDDEEMFNIVFNSIPKEISDFLNKTKICKTRRGYHYYFKVESDKVIKTHRFNSIKVEIRAEGSCVIMPPSVVNGHEYKWINNNEIVKLDEKGIIGLGNILKELNKAMLDMQSEESEEELEEEEEELETEDFDKSNGDNDSDSDSDNEEQDEQDEIDIDEEIEINDNIYKIYEDNDEFNELLNNLVDDILEIYIKGRRDSIIFALSGMLCKSDIDLSVAELILYFICSDANDEEYKERFVVLRRSYEKDKKDLAGASYLLNAIGGENDKNKKIVKKIEDEINKIKNFCDANNIRKNKLNNNTEKSKNNNNNNDDNNDKKIEVSVKTPQDVLNHIYQIVPFKSKPIKLIKCTTEPVAYSIEFDDGKNIFFGKAESLFNRKKFIINYFELYDIYLKELNENIYSSLLGALIDTMEYRNIPFDTYSQTILKVFIELCNDALPDITQWRSYFVYKEDGNKILFHFKTLAHHLEREDIDVKNKSSILKILSDKYKLGTSTHRVGGKTVRFYEIDASKIEGFSNNTDNQILITDEMQNLMSK